MRRFPLCVLALLLQRNFSWTGLDEKLRLFFNIPSLDKLTAVDILLLTTPAQHSYDNPSVKLDPKSLKTWLSELPTADVIETVKCLLNAIELFNEVHIHVETRLKLLELYKEALDLILYTYDDLRLRQLPLPAVQRQSLAEDIMWLYLGLANGYKTIVLYGHENQANPARDSALLLAIYRAMELIILALVYAFRSQSAAPPLAYLEIYQLYLYSEHHGVLNTAVKGCKDHNITPTIDRLFKQFVLLVIANPRKINSAEIYELHTFLEPFAASCVVTNNSLEADSDVKFCIDLFEDAPPEKLQHTRIDPASTSLRNIDISPALRDIEEWLAKHSKSNQSIFYERELQLLPQLLNIVSAKAPIVNTDFASNTNVRVAFGLATLLQFMDNPALMDSACQTKLDHNSEALMRDNPSGDRSTQLYHWLFYSTDDQRYFLFGNAWPHTAPSLSGELVGLVKINAETGKPGLVIARIKSTQPTENEVFKLEIEWLGGTAFPIICRKPGTLEQINPGCRGIYFPRDKHGQKPATLLLPNTFIEQFNNLQVEVMGQSFEVIIAQIINQSPLYTQFRFKAIQSESLGANR